MGKHRRPWLFGLFLGIIDAAGQTSVPLFLRYVINRISEDASGFLKGDILCMLGIAAAVVLVFFPSAYFFHVLVSVSNVRILRDIRTALYVHIQRLSADFFLRTRVGEICARINNDLAIGGQQFMNIFMFLVWSGAVAIFAVAMMLYISPELFLVFVVFAILVKQLSALYLPEIRMRTRAVRDVEGMISASITEYLSVLDLIRAFSREHEIDFRVRQDCFNVTQKAESLIWCQWQFVDIMQVLAKFVAPLSLLSFGAWLVSLEVIKVGDMVAFWIYWMLAGGLIQSLSNTMSLFFSGLASMDRVCEFFDEKPMVKDRPDATPITIRDGEIVFEDVTFNYPIDSEQTVLDKISFNVPGGKKLAIVGPSGAGKSTIIQLLMRFYDPIKGRVLIDGRDLRDIRQSSLRMQMGIVMQESVFLSGTIADNMRFARPDATEQEIWKALNAADAGKFIEETDDQLNTIIGERGARLSGGQKQRLAIARVFLKNPPILIFDEATSSLDSIAEAQIQSAMERLLIDRTAIIIAHRIQTVRNADAIAVIDGGHIIAQGRHDELLRQCPLYKKICRHQGLSKI